MDRYTFRGKRIDNGEWIYGLPHHCGNKLLILSDQVVEFEEEWIALESWWTIDPATLGQCTGLSAMKSYRGDRPEDLFVFDGDRIWDPEFGLIGIVTWSEPNMAWMVARDDGEVEYLMDFIDSHTDRVYKIIGNIHDNHDGEEE